MFSIPTPIQHNSDHKLHEFPIVLYCMFHHPVDININGFHSTVCASLPLLSPPIHPSIHRPSIYPSIHPSIRSSNNSDLLHRAVFLATVLCLIHLVSSNHSTETNRPTVRHLSKHNKMHVSFLTNGVTSCNRGCGSYQSTKPPQQQDLTHLTAKQHSLAKETES